LIRFTQNCFLCSGILLTLYTRYDGGNLPSLNKHADACTSHTLNTSSVFISVYNTSAVYWIWKEISPPLFHRTSVQRWRMMENKTNESKKPNYGTSAWYCITAQTDLRKHLLHRSIRALFTHKSSSLCSDLH